MSGPASARTCSRHRATAARSPAASACRRVSHSAAQQASVSSCSLTLLPSGLPRAQASGRGETHSPTGSWVCTFGIPGMRKIRREGAVDLGVGA